MTHRTAAARYARALLDVALKEQADLTLMESDLSDFAALMPQYPELEKVLLNPAVPVHKKAAAVHDLVARSGIQPILGRLLVLLAERDRLGLLSDLLEAFRQRLLEHRNIVRAEVTTAAALTTDRVTAIEQSLARATGRTVVLSTRVDPSIVGGIVARVGSTVYDASVTNHLRRLKQRLQESV